MADHRQGAPIRFTECGSCAASLVTQREWNAMTPQERREAAADGFRRQGVGPTCGACAKRAAGGENGA